VPKNVLAGAMLALVFCVPLAAQTTDPVARPATEAPPAAADPELEKQVMRLGEELRCLVCQNQTIADSNAELAVDLRNQVREMLRAGKSEKEIKEFMVQRYGDFVLYRPPVKPTTLVLWIGPFVLLLAGLALLFVKLRQRAARLQRESGLSQEEHLRAAALLGEGAGTAAASGEEQRR
jgi:cytochrome c-type biogenesis protein CcmH